MYKQARRYLRIIIPLTILFYFVPVIALIFVVCGIIDISRHRVVTGDLATKYFTGNGLPTWLLSPLNVFLDLISARNKIVYRLEDFPDAERQEIECVLKTFDDQREEIIGDIREKMAGKARSILFYKWYDKNTNDAVLAFNRDMTYVKTIGGFGLQQEGVDLPAFRPAAADAEGSLQPNAAPQRQCLHRGRR